MINLLLNIKSKLAVGAVLLLGYLGWLKIRDKRLIDTERKNRQLDDLRAETETTDRIQNVKTHTDAAAARKRIADRLRRNGKS